MASSELIAYTPDPDILCSVAAKMCYADKPLEHVLYKNSLKQAIASGHESVLEHASFTFRIRGISRVALAQLTRHRIASYSVKSQRYGSQYMTDILVFPNGPNKDFDLAELPETKAYMEALGNLCRKLHAQGFANEDIRYLWPEGTETDLMLTMNARELRHFFSLRCCNRAQAEIRELADSMLEQVRKVAPIMFENAGAPCVRDQCYETKPCGNPRKEPDVAE